MYVRLQRNWPGNFRRNIRDGGKIVATLNFTPGEMVEITEPAALAAIADDLGKALEILMPKDLRPAPAAVVTPPVHAEPVVPIVTATEDAGSVLAELDAGLDAGEKSAGPPANLDQMTRKELVELCDRLGLPHNDKDSRNRLHERLTEHYVVAAGAA